MTKNILIIDQSNKTVELLNLIVTMFTDYKTFVEINKNNILNLLENGTFEYIIIDHIIEFSDEIITFILKKHPKQKVILLSDNIKCPLSCEDCSFLFQFVRLIKPSETSILLNYLNPSTNFLCPNKDKFSSINTIQKLYEFINLEENSFYKKKDLVDNKLIVKSSIGNINISELSRIEKLINESFFSININENNDIEISVK